MGYMYKKVDALQRIRNERAISIYFLIFGIPATIIGIVCVILVLVYGPEAEMIGISLALLGGGLAMLIPSIIGLRNANRRITYISLVEGKERVSIDNLSGVIGNTFSETTKEINSMIKSGHLNGYIDIENRQFVHYNKDKSINNHRQIYEYKTKPQTCPACGAPNSAEAVQNGKCEYCGAALSRKIN